MALIHEISLFSQVGMAHLGDLERLKLTLEGIDDEKLMQHLENKRGKGRDDNPIRVMWNLIIAMIVFEHNTISSFIRELKRNAQLRLVCGLDDFVKNKKNLTPSNGAFSRFISSLEEEDTAPLVSEIFEDLIEKLYELIPGFGKNLAGDGKYLDSFSKRKNKKLDSDGRRETDAEYSIKEYTYIGTDGKEHVKKETHYGFRVHIICDVTTELPVAFQVTKANKDEKKVMLELLNDLPDKQCGLAETIALDRGYDSIDMIKTIKGLGILPVIDIRNMWKDPDTTKQYKNTNIVYNAKGEVFYVNDELENVKMKYEGYDKNKRCLRYSYNKKKYKIYISYDERIFLPIARDSEKFRKLYNGRTAVERLNGRIDKDYMFEKHTIRGLKKMSLMLTLSMIVMNGMAVGKVMNNLTSLRSLKKVS